MTRKISDGVARIKLGLTIQELVELMDDADLERLATSADRRELA